jgi:hypothetical protein
MLRQDVIGPVPSDTRRVAEEVFDVTPRTAVLRHS